MDTLNEQKRATNFYCKKCDYICFSKFNFDRHVATEKHKRIHLDTLNEQKRANNYYCVCGKIYKYSQGLSKHKQTCLIITQSQIETQVDTAQLDTSLVIELLKQNQELQKSLIELSKEKGITNNSINNNISNKQTFNIQVYLNEDCKDALNISDFVNSIKLQLHDLEETGRLGYVDGVSKIITTKLNDLDATKRPIQCSDIKRETLYIKDENKWIKEDDKKEKIKTAIKQIARKNIQQIPIWVKENPGCLDPDSKQNDTYLHIVANAMSGSSSEEQSNNINKIVTKISKETIIDK
jgi:hypothetical protein